MESHGPTNVLIASLSTGGVAIKDISLTPDNAICNVRGMGVAESARTWILPRIFLSCSFCATPKCCSSSIIRRPRLLKLIVFDNNE